MAKYLGVDYGLARTGLAYGDDENFLAVPYDVLQSSDVQELIEAIRNICVQEEISSIIVGVPLSKEEKKYQQMEKVKTFIEFFKKKVQLPIIEEDERFSTRMAAKLNPKGDDSVAAAVILQGYLDRLKGGKSR